MKKSLLVVILIILVLAIAGVVLALYWNPLKTNTNDNTNSGVTTNTNAATNIPDSNTVAQETNTHFDYRADVVETKDVEKPLVYEGGTVTIARVDVKNGLDYDGVLPEGKKAVYIYLKPQDLKNTEKPVYMWTVNEMVLIDSNNESYTATSSVYPADSAIANGVEPNIVFLVNETSSGFTFKLSRAGEEVVLPLGI